MKPSRSKASMLEKAIFSLQMVLVEHYMTATTIRVFLFYFLSIMCIYSNLPQPSWLKSLVSG